MDEKEKGGIENRKGRWEREIGEEGEVMGRKKWGGQFGAGYKVFEEGKRSLKRR